MENFKISIVMAVLNRVAVVEQAISSVVNQTYDNIEFVIIDGGSTDGTLDIIRKYSDKIAYWVSEPDTGLYNALNKGINHTTGDYIQILGSDDCLYDAQTIQHIVQALQDAPDVLCCEVCNIETDCRFEWVTGTNDNFLIQPPPHQGMFTKRDVLLKYPFDEQYKVASDYDFKLSCYVDSEIRIKRSSIKAAYYAIGGFSGINREIWLREVEEIYWKYANGKEWRKSPSVFGEATKNILKWLGVFEKVRLYVNLYIRRKWKRHHCDNKICRWCGRK